MISRCNGLVCISILYACISHIVEGIKSHLPDMHLALALALRIQCNNYNQTNVIIIATIINSNSNNITIVDWLMRAYIIRLNVKRDFN